MNIVDWLLFATWLVAAAIAVRSLSNSVRQYRALREVRRERRTRTGSHPLHILEPHELEAMIVSPRNSTVWLTNIPDPWRSDLALGTRLNAVYANLLRQRADLLKWGTELLVAVAAVFAGVYANDLLASLQRGDSVQMLVAGFPVFVMAGASMVGLTLVPTWRTASQRYRAMARGGAGEVLGQAQAGQGRAESAGEERRAVGEGTHASAPPGPDQRASGAERDRPPSGGRAHGRRCQTDESGKLDVPEDDTTLGCQVQKPEAPTGE